MMFVTVGTITFPFNRMAKVVEEVVKQKIYQGKIVVQGGSTTKFRSIPGIQLIDFMSHDQMIKNLQQADIVLMHGGEGSLLEAMENCHVQPIIFPRRKEYLEHVDSYQEEVASVASSRGWAIKVNTIREAIKLLEADNLRDLLTKVGSEYAKKLKNDELIDFLIKITS